MDFVLSDDQLAIDESVRKICAQFDDGYWTDCEENARFPQEYYRSMADSGWLGITMPEELGGAGLGVTEAAIMMHAVTSSGGGYSAASAIHINLFGPHSIVVHGTPEQKHRWLVPLIKGEQKACFGVTEPDAGLDTTSIKTFATRTAGGYKVSGRKIWTSTAQVADKILLLTRTTPKSECKRPGEGMTLFYTDLDRAKIEVRRIHKMGRNAVDSNAVFIDNIFIPEEDRVGEEGRGFEYIFHSLNPERVLVATEAIGVGRDALQRAARYAKERVVFGRPIGKNQGIQHPLAECWAYLESAYWMCLRAGWLYDQGLSCAVEANSAKLLAGRAAFQSCTRAVLTHGGMGYAREYQVERLFRESILTRIAPVSEELILSFLAEKALGLPKSY
ncbi:MULTISPECIES: acyl-CoA dehydrogenase family protein [unclassified Chelatococcus]|jgi:acyl-CoA dehydrogenase|uniref:acyl-CoA dehydrogenase family protein n=1 Tax=unclassified Chelatococcus TaxID=2638111 RepID=UPI001BD10C98|nr:MULTISPECIES: acyl-CoA dehydrogenase family protein [unclassified Chelatococcus]CAH1654883.1 Acyl-CoA/acyl-ACP dehydrogenase [Hyphomicrobiales bacterium]MBS7742727.1 acyl-CoA/acyl-ACP dehydrogenase [Chelatococcus sp. HY11]MBX3542155.1 acyl-CoA/acyl-ACP dehydrogenase [Chelatococcus sp.]MCO5075630.1 acyl-CoA/acyl-ACP dehydrogenase [Chelatococcus sp.]CAH1695127.1 Acyl-CoA/acyl-ACP dehydrogenase [Hyphomicrobiales bacterium]